MVPAIASDSAKSTNKDTLYFATSFGDGYIVRSAIPMKIINGFELIYIKYYILVMVAVLLITSLFSSKLGLYYCKAYKRPRIYYIKNCSG